MADPAELRTLIKQLAGNPNDAVILNVLAKLRKDFVVNESILRETKAGLAVGKLRSHPSKAVSDAAKDIVKKWKTDVDRAKAAQSGIGGTAQRKQSTASMSTPTTTKPGAPKAGVRNAKGDFPGGVKQTHDTTRDKCIELLYDALAVDSDFPKEKLLTTATAVEAAVLHAHGGSTTTEYKARIRSLFVNLKDKNNPGLKAAVANGDIEPGKFAVMSSADMASEERKAADKAIRDQNMFKSLAAADQEAETEGFQCGRCKQRKCRYRQAQTRSADEPMTTFVTCTNCGHKWKFS